MTEQGEYSTINPQLHQQLDDLATDCSRLHSRADRHEHVRVPVGAAAAILRAASIVAHHRDEDDAGARELGDLARALHESRRPRESLREIPSTIAWNLTLRCATLADWAINAGGGDGMRLWLDDARAHVGMLDDWLDRHAEPVAVQAVSQ